MASVQFDGGKHTTKQATSGHIPHDFRERDNYSNEDIDKSRTHLNQKFGCQTGDEARSKLIKRIAECDAIHPPKRMKQDRKTSIEIHIPAPRENLDDKKLREFFERSYAELENTFGKENVIYGVTHFDEVHDYIDPKDKQVHSSRAGLHAVIVPFTDDMSFVPEEKKSGLNMNNFYRKNLPTLVNKKLDAVCQDVFGFNFQDGTKTVGKETVEQLKSGSRRIKKQKKAIEHNKVVIENQKAEYDSYTKDLTDLEAREQALFDREQAFEEEKGKWYSETKKALETEYKRKEDALNKSVEEYKEQLEQEHKEKLRAALKEQDVSIKQFREWKRNERHKQAEDVMQDSDEFQRELPT